MVKRLLAALVGLAVILPALIWGGELACACSKAAGSYANGAVAKLATRYHPGVRATYSHLQDDTPYLRPQYSRRACDTRQINFSRTTTTAPRPASRT